MSAHILVYFVRFYQIQGYTEWGRDTDEWGRNTHSDESDSSNTSSRSPRRSKTLEDAVHTHPLIAHRALAAHLGLSYDEIQRFMERAQEMGRARTRENIK